jgi:hypothetical protein
MRDALLADFFRTMDDLQTTFHRHLRAIETRPAPTRPRGGDAPKPGTLEEARNSLGLEAIWTDSRRTAAHQDPEQKRIFSPRLPPPDDRQ